MCIEVKMHGECLYKKGAEFMVFLARGVQDNIPSFATPIALALIKEELGLPVIFFTFLFCIYQKIHFLLLILKLFFNST